MRRFLHSRSRHALCCLGYLALVACAADQAGPHDLDGEPAAQLAEPTGEVSPSPFTTRPFTPIDSSWCTRRGTVAEVALHAPTALGFSAEEVLARAVKPATSQPVRLAWSALPGLTSLPETGEHTLQVAVEPRRARMRTFKPGGETIGHGLVCQNWMEIDVTLTLRSDQGAFREQIEATLYTQRPDAAYAEAVAQGGRLSGALRLERTDDALEVVPAAYFLSLGFSDLGVSGHLRTPNDVEIATIGAGRCRSGTHAVALETALIDRGVSGRAALDWLETRGPRQVTWADGTTTELAVRFTPSSAACVIDSDGQVAYPVRSRTLSVSGTLELRSADGRMSISFATDFYVWSRSTIDAPGFRVAVSTGRFSPPDTKSLGFPKPLDAKFESIYLDVVLEAEMGAIDGTVTLRGYQREPALPGNGYRLLEQGTLH